MFPSVIEAERGLEAFVASFDPDLVSILDCTDLVGRLCRIERLVVAAKVLAARRVPDGASWRAEGDRSPAAWLARKTGTSVGDASAVFDTAKRLEALPATEAALRAGRLSGVQVRDVADAATVAPDAEAVLLRTAEREGAGALRTKARAIKVAGADDAERQRRIHAGRYLRTYTDDEGAFCGRFRTTANRGAELLVALHPFQEAAFRAARKAGRLDKPEVHAIDGLLAMAEVSYNTGTQPHHTDDAHRVDGRDGGHPDDGRSPDAPLDRSPATSRRSPRKRLPPRSLGSQTKVIYNVTYEALVRGYPLDGETCELVGVGPVPVAAVQAAMEDAFLAGVLTKGVDIAAVAHLGRKATVLQQTAMEFRNPICDVEGCDCLVGVQIDHDTGWAKTYRTELNDLNKLCPFHHYLKTVHGWTLQPGTGKRPMRPPDNPPPPEALARPNPRRRTPLRTAAPIESPVRSPASREPPRLALG